MAVKIRRLKPLQSETTEANEDDVRVIRVKNNVAFKVDSRYLQEVQNQSRYDKARRDRDMHASMELAGSKVFNLPQCRGNEIKVIQTDETIPIVTDDGHLCCDACGCEIVDGQESCENCKREINWSK